MESPFSQSSLISKLVFLWPNSILELARNKENLQLEDLPSVPIEYNVTTLYDEFKILWEKEIKKNENNNMSTSSTKGPNLIKILLFVCWKKNAWISVIVFTESVARIYQAVALGKFINYLLDTNTSDSIYENGYFISFLISICGIFITFAHHQFFFYAWGLGLQLRLITTAAIYEKATKLHLRSLNQLPSGYGHIVNLCSQDVESFQLFGTFFHFLYQPIIESLGVLVVGILTIGTSFLGF